MFYSHDGTSLTPREQLTKKTLSSAQIEHLGKRLELPFPNGDQYVTHTEFIQVCAMILHKSGKINDAKLKAMFKQSYEPQILKRLHHCSIDDRWYDDMSFVQIYSEILDDMRSELVPINAHDVITYLNKLISKPYNYCVSHARDKFFLPMTDYIMHSYRKEEINSLLPDTVRGVTLVADYNFEYDRSCSSWCCEDCDGPFESERDFAYQLHFQNFERSVAQGLHQAFYDLKKKHAFN